MQDPGQTSSSEVKTVAHAEGQDICGKWRQLSRATPRYSHSRHKRKSAPQTMVARVMEAHAQQRTRNAIIRGAEHVCRCVP